MSPLLFQGHVDVVAAAASAWTHPPFAGVVEDRCVWGRGALDMKGGVAMMIWALLEASARDLRPAGDVIFVALSDEEAGGRDGAEFLVSEHAELFDGVRYSIGEFGGFSVDFAGRRLYLVQVAEKRVCRLQLRVRGEPGHASMPRPGATIGELGSLLVGLDRVRLPTHITPAAEAMVDGLAASLPAPFSLAVRGGEVGWAPGDCFLELSLLSASAAA